MAVNDFGLVESVDRLGQRVAHRDPPLLPTEGSKPTSASRSVSRIETYYALRSLW